MTASRDSQSRARDRNRAVPGAVSALEQLAGGLITALLALGVLLALVVVAVACAVGVGLLAVPAVLRAVHTAADRERTRTGLLPVPPPEPPETGLGRRRLVLDRTGRRELGWLALHATVGLLLGLVGVLLPVFALRDLSFPLWWLWLPNRQGSASLGFWVVDDWPGVALVALLGVGWVLVIVLCAPALARLQALPGRRLLSPDTTRDLPLRVAQLTATRAAALDAHAAELRRIERSLHDGSQNRLVAVTVLLGAARRALQRDQAIAGELLDRAQSAAETALRDLRVTARTILPPVLSDRGLVGALDGLAADCPLPCELVVDVSGRCAASVEATAYFAVAEALTNAVRHSQADSVSVIVRRQGERLHLRVRDNGRGGADAAGGSGLSGMRRRVQAHDGTLRVSSPAAGPTVLEVDLPCGS